MQQVFYALNAHLQALGLPLPVAGENRDFTPPDNDYWLAAWFVPASEDPVTMGQAGLNAETGFYQIDINAPPNKGVGKAIDYLQQLKSHFRAGTALTGAFGRVVLNRCDFSPGSGNRNDSNPNGTTKTLTVYWTAYSTRG